MEVAGDGDANPPPESWEATPDAAASAAAEAKPPKRKMKTPYQLEVLEQTYAVEMYPSEALRAELSAKIGLTDRQLQMWFCHRRLKDKKGPPPAKKAKTEETPTPPPPPVKGSVMPASDVMLPSPFGGSSSGEPRKVAARAARMETSGSAGRRYYEPPLLAPPQMMAPVPVTSSGGQLSMTELRVIASVEAQLGEALREDGPILGVEFEPVPPGAFGAPIVTPPPKQPMRSFNGKLYERHDAKSIKTSAFLPSMEHCFMPSSSNGKRKSAVGGAHVVHPQAGSRPLHEYQFLPEQPSIRVETYERESHFHDSPVVAPNPRVSSLPRGGQYLHGDDQVSPDYTSQGQTPSIGNLSQHGRQQMFSPGPTEYENVANTVADAQFGVHQAVGSENPCLSSDRRILHEEDASLVERKRKNEEARIAKEVEAHEKRIRKELEKQDIMRRKREEQMRREMERHDRERRKEEERLMREKQREEERFQREQRREIERREKYLQKESLRVEKMKQKEELRREKEAARLKAANERATARRLAREYMELVEDERLELMELAASSKGLSSIVSLDSETLQQLDMFRDMLSAFPPKSVQLKRPFAIYPWIESEENIANLFMVWKFLDTFADVLELWPLTLDEFLQALHDYDSKLLGEIHVSLLKSIIKDIEDVARTPAIGLGANQNCAANPGGGHPHIVERAYRWGFDIRSWQRHLNFLTWPEILRQFAMSAGFGPQLKKRNMEGAYFRDENEGNDGEDVISTLRNGAAAENAVALMHEKGYSHRRKSRHRLTPGTVKFAAFHVLSLEGSRGLTILEVADKIQKSGLRDLTTSKTPEASIAAALSRDTKLFERTAPSTYCVRPAYRKDPADADAILSAAREKMQVFQNVISGSEVEKDVEDTDDVERDDDSECDGADDPEVDDTNTDAKSNNNAVFANELRDARPSASVDYEKGEVLGDVVGVTPRSGSNVDKTLSVISSGNSNLTSVSGTHQSLEMSPNFPGINTADANGMEIDDSNLGEPWVQSLTDGDYYELSTKERLDALVALIDVAIEGNSIRVILEERLEAASALKKQMWADAQLDKRRSKEDNISKLQYSSFVEPKNEVSQKNAAIEGSQTPADIDNNGTDGNPITDVNDRFLDPQFQVNNMSAERNPLGQDFPINADSTPLQQYAYVAEKSRSQLKSYIGYKAEKLHVYRSLPLGQDRRRNRYWMFCTSASPNDRGTGRIFFESKDGFWRLIDSKEAFDSLLNALDTRGVRESHLHSMLQRIELNFKEAVRRNKMCTNSTCTDESLVKTETLDTTSSPDCHIEVDSPNSNVCGLSSDTPEYSTSFKIELGRSEMERTSASKRYQIFVKWIWTECYNPSVLCALKYGKKRCPELLQTCPFCYECYFVEERHCSSCHKTFNVHSVDAIFSDHMSICELKGKMDPNSLNQVSDSSLPIGIQLLKAQLSLIEVSVPAEALQPFWTDDYRKAWGVKLHSSSSAEDLLQLVTLLEGAIKRDYLSSNYETTSELLGSAKAGFLVEDIAPVSRPVSVLPWVADSTAAVALRLLDLDASILYMLHQKLELHTEKETNNFIKLPSRFTVVKNIQELGSAEILDQDDYMREARWIDRGSGRRGRGRGGCPRGRGGRPRGRGGRGLRAIGSSSRAEIKEENISNYQKTTWKHTRGRTRGRGRKRGCRTIITHQRSESRVPVAKESRIGSSFSNIVFTSKQDSFEDSPGSSGGNEWGLQETGTSFVEAEDNSIASTSDDENGVASGDEYDDQASDYVNHYGQNQPTGMLDEETEEEDEDEDEDDVAHVGHREMDVHIGHREMDVHIGHREMDADVDDEDEEEMGDEDRDDIGGDGNAEEDDSYSSEYSD